MGKMNELEIKKMAKELYKKYRGTYIFEAVFIWSLIIILLFSSLFIAKESNVIVLGLSALFCIILFCMWLSFTILFFKTKNIIKKNIYTYHYLDISRYEGCRGGFEVYYHFEGQQHSTITSIYGANKIHVLKCGSEYLCKVENP